ncbi:MAG: homoserine kinase [Cetobacterium sp.]
MITIRVPATTANIGPGFDSLGMAFQLYSYFTFEEIGNKVKISGCEKEFQNEENLVYTAFKYTLDRLGKKVKGISIGIKSDIPVSRGLGSSAACIVAGVMGANILSGNILNQDEIFEICTTLEGHPDNVAPAIYGGLTASIVEKNKPYTVHYDIHKEIYFCAIIPEFEVSTKKSREILPEFVSHKDAVFNISRVAVLLKAFERGDGNLIKNSLADSLHEKYRKKLIYEFEEVKKICEKNENTAFFISGSGSTLINVSKNCNFDKKINFDLKKLKNNWKVKSLGVDFDGAVQL